MTHKLINIITVIGFLLIGVTVFLVLQNKSFIIDNNAVVEKSVLEIAELKKTLNERTPYIQKIQTIEHELAEVKGLHKKLNECEERLKSSKCK